MVTYIKTSPRHQSKMSNNVLARAGVLRSKCIRSHLADTKVCEPTRACVHKVALLGTCKHTCAYAFVNASKCSTASKNEQEPHVSTCKPVVVALPCAVTVRCYALANGRSCEATGSCQREQTCLLVPCGHMKAKHVATMCCKLLCTRVRPATGPSQLCASQLSSHGIQRAAGQLNRLDAGSSCVRPRGCAGQAMR